MKKINVGFLFPLTALVVLIFVLSERIFDIFPVGKLLDPFIGAIQDDGTRDLNLSRLEIHEKGLTDSVKIYFDERKVPHIYAKNAEDLYFAQGYVTASLRLWQMDFISYVSAGRLSEILSDLYVGYDRGQRRLGILDAARATLKLIEADPKTDSVLTAYCRGVNAYINKLSYKTFPFEYKLLDYKPEPWSKLKTILVMEYLGNAETGYDEDYTMSNMMVALGEGDFNKLYPSFPLPASPMVNDSAGQPNPALSYIKKPDYLNYSFLASSSVIGKSPYNPRLGSNSWAVSGRKTRSGHPILCSDPHLDLSLPCIWLEMQLSSPDMNVYGVSIPGVPAIVIGFNDNIAWGITNGADDVKDWYKLKVTGDYKKYELDGKWLDMTYTVEEIKRRGKRSWIDTVYHTIQGPVVDEKNFLRQPEYANCALRWELQHPSNGFSAFIKLNKASNYKEYQEAIKNYSCPTLNFTFACKDNTIAVKHQGKMLQRQPGEGRFILDGTRSSSLYSKYIPEDSLPEVLNPSCNYVLSANQQPTNTRYPYYYNGYYAETRANRIRQLLEMDDGFDISKMKAMQLDNTNSFAVDALPVICASLDKQKLSVGEASAAGSLKTWKGTYEIRDENALLFELWWKNIRELTWDEFNAYSFYWKAPDDYALLNLIRKEPANNFFDLQGTPEKETADDIVLKAFKVALEDYGKRKREKGIQWGDTNRISLLHLTTLPAFSITDLPSAGNPETIDAKSTYWGPSWRMIVELGDRPKAFGIYAGGQSGDVGSPFYDNFVSDWNKGNYYPLQFYMSIGEAQAQTTHSWVLNK